MNIEKCSGKTNEIQIQIQNGANFQFSENEVGGVDTCIFVPIEAIFGSSNCIIQHVWFWCNPTPQGHWIEDSKKIGPEMQEKALGSMAVEWRRKKDDWRCHFKEKMSLEQAHHHRKPWIRA
ncbi:hypothetical protein GmHk_05G013081 [Glycine max]|nr:hypothetical protein GmHk_05G013081 [Glycine max]